jgi:hypothetical protein
MALLGNTQLFIRGATIQFSTTFYDVNNNLVIPDSATINILPAQATTAVQVAMTPPGGGSFIWTALWDTRGIPAPQDVYWSIHTGSSDPIPVTAEDGVFRLTANPANLVTF